MKRRPARDPRPAAQIREHYEVERDLGNRLREAPPHERPALYRSVYDELFRRVPHHPMLTRASSNQQERLKWQLGLLSPFLDEHITFLELGPGDCTLAFAVARQVKMVYAVDVRETIASAANVPPNFRSVLDDGGGLDVPADSVDLVYSNQLMEHLHPDDAAGQLTQVLRALVPGGAYVCITPNRLSGPHDISGAFDTVATGLHLREYTVTQLSALFLRAGFVETGVYVGGNGRYWKWRPLPVMALERVLQLLPRRVRRAIAGTRVIGSLIGVRLVGFKGGERLPAR